MTDGEIAVEIAIERGADELVLVGAFGGDAHRPHLPAHDRRDPAGRGRHAVELTSGDQEGWPLLPGERAVRLWRRHDVCVLAFSDLAGLTLDRVHWPLTDRFVPFGSSLTLSNVVQRAGRCGRAACPLGSGRALLIAHPLTATGA